MKIGVVNSYDTKGGAARAAFRINQALVRSGLDSMMLVDIKTSQNAYVIGYESKLKKTLKHLSAKALIAAFNFGKVSSESTALFNSDWPSRLNRSSLSLVHLNWLNAEMMSIEDVSKIKKPLVWTIHDMWPFSGTSHYVFDEQWKYGYNLRQHGFLQSWVWKRKLNHWKTPIHIVCPSQWLSECVKQSPLMKSWPVSVIPNAIDTDFWHPKNQYKARKKLKLSENSKIIMFGAIGSLSNYVKGFDLLIQTLKLLTQESEQNNYELLIVGEEKHSILEDIDIPCHFTGHLSDDEMLRECYNAADVVVVPSRLEAFGQVASEAQSCGTPVAAFATSGLLDVVAHLETGYLAEPYNTQDLAYGIQFLLQNKSLAEVSGTEALSSTKNDMYSKMGHNARQRVEKLFSYPVVAEKYKELYCSILKTTLDTNRGG